jgi:hypothetical protein
MSGTTLFQYNGKVKLKFTQEQVRKAQRENTGIALLFL